MDIFGALASLLAGSKFNIVAGINNSGKTSILEAISLLRKPLDVSNVVRIARSRDIMGPYFLGKGNFDYIDSFINMFSTNQDANNIELSGIMYNQSISFKISGTIEKRILNTEEIKKKLKDRHVYLKDSEMVDGEIDFFSGLIECTAGDNHYEEPVLFSRLDRLVSDRKINQTIEIELVMPIDHIVWNERLDDVIKEGLKSEIIDLLKIFDPQIKGLEIVKGIPYIEHNILRPMPLSTYGDGLKKVLLLAISVIRAKNGLLLIDEIETAIHVRAMKSIFDWFIEACKKYKVQVFATTHSLEVIDAMLDSAKADRDQLRIITLKKQDQKTLARILTGKEALDSREEFDMELR